jgi:hypothetical protein
MRKYFLLCLLLCTQLTFVFSQNAIVTENALPGNPISEWGVPDFRDTRVNGFATEISVNKGQTVYFKINSSSAASVTISIYRLGYYSGNGARKMADLGTIPGTSQPSGINNSTTGLYDCSNWSISAQWAVPSTAVSGVYIAKLTRAGGGSNHIIFIVRDDSGNSDILFQLTDATWQAYNGYGGSYLYAGTTGFPNGRAVKVSYNRPIFPYNSGFATDNRQSDWYMNSEFPMIKWIERNGYNVSYTSCVEVAMMNIGQKSKGKMWKRQEMPESIVLFLPVTTFIGKLGGRPMQRVMHSIHLYAIRKEQWEMAPWRKMHAATNAMGPLRFGRDYGGQAAITTRVDRKTV